MPKNRIMSLILIAIVIMVSPAVYAQDENVSCIVLKHLPVKSDSRLMYFDKLKTAYEFDLDGDRYHVFFRPLEYENLTCKEFLYSSLIITYFSSPSFGQDLIYKIVNNIGSLDMVNKSLVDGVAVAHFTTNFVQVSQAIIDKFGVGAIDLAINQILEKLLKREFSYTYMMDYGDLLLYAKNVSPDILDRLSKFDYKKQESRYIDIDTMKFIYALLKNNNVSLDESLMYKSLEETNKKMQQEPDAIVRGVEENKQLLAEFLNKSTPITYKDVPNFFEPGP